MRIRLKIFVLLAVSVCMLREGAVICTAEQEDRPAVHLEEWMQLEDGREVPWQDNPVILPGSRVSKIPRIVNDGPPVWIRVKIVIRGTEAEQAIQNGIFGMPEGWRREADGYYYFYRPLAEGETVTLFEGIRIPEDFPQKEAGKQIRMDITVEAQTEASASDVQSRPKNVWKAAPVDTGDRAGNSAAWIFRIMAAAAGIISIRFVCRRRKS